MRNELDAVNAVLRALGNAETEMLDDGDMDTISARSFLRDAKAAVLKNGWYFNRVTRDMAPSASTGEVILPRGYLWATAKGYVPRGNKLWDATNNTYNIGQAVTVNYVLDTEWEELPFAAYEAVVTLARYQALRDLDGDRDRVSMLYDEHQQSLAALRREDVQWNQYNIFNSPKMSAAMQRIKPTGGYHAS